MSTTERLDSIRKTNIYSDDPVECQDQDRFGWVPYAESIADVTCEVPKQTASAVIALVGPWGCGKSSMLHFVRAEIQKSQIFKIVEFNPWMVSDLSSLIVDFFDTLTSAIPSKEHNLRQKMKLYAKKATPLLSSLSIAGVNIDIKSILSDDEDDGSLADLRTGVEASLTSLSSPILIVLDDIDRLQPDELIVVFKLIRLIGRLPKVYYLIAFDESSLLNSLSRAVGDHDRARAGDYLEKMVQIRLDMPPLDELAAADMFSGFLDGMLQRHNRPPLDLDSISRLSVAWRNLFAHSLDNPRQIKRFCSDIEASLELTASDLDFADYVTLRFLSECYPSVVEMFRLHRKRLFEQSIRRRFSKSPVWEKLLIEAGISEVRTKTLARVLDTLFPPSSVDHTERAHIGRICDPLAFDRYLNPTTLRTQLDNLKASEALREGFNDSKDSYWRDIVEFIRASPERALDELYQLAPRYPDAKVILVHNLFRIVPFVPIQSGLVRLPRKRYYDWIVELLEELDARAFEYAGVLDDTDIHHVAAVLCYAHGATDLSGPEQVLSGLRANAIEELKKELDSQARRPICETRNVIRLLGAWEMLETRSGSSSAPLDWIQQKIDDGVWSEDDVRRLVDLADATTTGERRRVLWLDDLYKKFIAKMGR